jgi:hypothetical protein
MQPINYGPFTVSANLRGFTVSRENGKVELVPGMCAQAIKLVQQALSLQEWLVLPETISSSPIMIRFTGERVMYLSDKNKQGEVAFKFEEGDDLIAALSGGLQSFKDETTLKGRGPKGGFSSSYLPDPVIVGRD